MISEENGNSKNKSFLKGAFILGLAGLLIKILGAAFRIPLTNIIGDDGISYYQTSYPIYNLFLSISTAGIPTAISRMVAERHALDRPGDADKVFKVSVRLMFIIGLVSSSIFLFGADYITGNILKEPGAAWCMRAIAPALLLVPVMASFRGYFQGRQNMKPTAASQLVEQVFRVGVGLTLAVVLLGRGKNIAAAGASFGASAGGLFGLIAIFLIYLKQRGTIKSEIESAGPAGQASESAKHILVSILMIAVPITIGTAILPLFNTVDTLMIKQRLISIGFEEDIARRLYGQLTGMASSLINFPQVLMQAVAISIVPVIASSFKRREHDFMRENIALGLRYIMILSLPMAVGMSVLARPIMLLFYPLQKEAAISAAGCLSILAVGIVFLGMGQIFTGSLQGMGRQWIPVANLFIGGICKVICTYVFTGMPSINVRGGAIGTVVAYAVAAILNMIWLIKLSKVRFNVVPTVVKPLCSAAVMGVIVYFAYRVLSPRLGNAIPTVISVGVGVVVYVIMIFLTRAISAEELERLPKGKGIVRLLRKVRLVR